MSRFVPAVRVDRIAVDAPSGPWGVGETAAGRRSARNAARGNGLSPGTSRRCAAGIPVALSSRVDRHREHGARREVEVALAGEQVDPSALLIFRALQGTSGKVEIGGRRYTFSCIPIFRLTDDLSGHAHDCGDSASLLELIRTLRGESRARRCVSLRRS